MRNSAGFSGENLTLDDIAYYYLDSEHALRAYFTGTAESVDPKLVGYAPGDVFEIRLNELDSSTALTILAALEAALRVDYLERVKKRHRDQLSKAFREIYKLKEHRASLEDDILDAWRDHGGADSKLIGNLKGAFKYRHWLAHGRYWIAKLPRKYDYLGVYTLADEFFDTLPLMSSHSAS
jgi:hypothetical protein